MLYKSKKRIYIIFSVLITILFVLVLRLAQLQIFDGRKLSVLANSQYTYSESTSDLNFDILDSENVSLLKFTPEYYAVIDPNTFETQNQDTNLDELYSLNYILKNYDSSYDILNRQIQNGTQKAYFKIDLETYNKIKEIKDVKGFYTYIKNISDNSSVYNIVNLLKDKIKPDKSGLKSKESLEMQMYKSVKDNEYPKIVFNKDMEGKVVSPVNVNPSKNVNFKLTINKKVQDAIESVIRSSKYKDYKQIGAVLMETQTGNILGLAQKDDSLPNIDIGYSSAGFYPGSIFKVVVEEAALETKSINLNDKFTCTGRTETLTDRLHGTLTPEGALIVSCNDIFSQIGRKTGFKNILNYAKQEGLLDKVLNMDGEISGDYDKIPENEGGSTLISVGQAIRITPVGAVSIANCVANKGIYIKPHIIDSLVDSNGKTVKKFESESKRVISESSADTLKRQMINVVKSGTGTLAQIQGVEIGGKTGTPQSKGGFDGWFDGFFKINGKYYSLTVYVPEIIGEDSGGSTGGRIFADVVNKTGNMLN